MSTTPESDARVCCDFFHFHFQPPPQPTKTSPTVSPIACRGTTTWRQFHNHPNEQQRGRRRERWAWSIKLIIFHIKFHFRLCHRPSGWPQRHGDHRAILRTYSWPFQGTLRGCWVPVYRVLGDHNNNANSSSVQSSSTDVHWCNSIPVLWMDMLLPLLFALDTNRTMAWVVPEWTMNCERSRFTTTITLLFLLLLLPLLMRWQWMAHVQPARHPANHPVSFQQWTAIGHCLISCLFTPQPSACCRPRRHIAAAVLALLVNRQRWWCVV